MPNYLDRIAPGSSSDDIIRTTNDNFTKIDNEAVTKTFAGANGTNSIVQGRLPNDLGYGQIFYDPNGLAKIYMAVDPDGNPIMKVAKDGKDATTGSDADMIFNSAQNVFKIVKIMDISVAAVSQSGAGESFVSASSPHGLSQTPIVMGFVTVVGERSMMPYTSHSGVGGGVVIRSQIVYADATNVTVLSSVVSTVAGTYSIPAFTAKVYVLQETAN